MKYNHKQTQTFNKVGLKYGFRSGLEIAISQELDANSVKYEYEKVKLKYTKPEKIHTYTPDFHLQDKDIFIETKGLSLVKDMRILKDKTFHLIYNELEKDAEYMKDTNRKR